MERGEFEAMLANEGFKEIVTVERPANGSMELHAHPFEAKALILDGEISLRAGEAEAHYAVGQVFHLGADVPHTERYGPQGVRYMVGRKSLAST